MKIRSFAIAILAGMALTVRAETIMDQIGADNRYTSGEMIYASQEFTDYPGNPGPYDIVAIDDFTTTATGFIVKQVEAVMGFWNGPAGPQDILAYRLEIYSAPVAAGSSLVGDVASLLLSPHQVFVTAWDLSYWNSHLFTFCGLNIPLAQNRTYWVGVIPVMPFSTAGQVGTSTSTFIGFPANWNAVQANPAQGFGAGRFWGLQRNLAFRVEAVPEPATLVVLGAGLLALIRRRR